MRGQCCSLRDAFFPEGFAPVLSANPIDTQVARLLEQIQVLDRHYGPIIAERDSNLAQSLVDAATSIDRYLAETHPLATTRP